MLLRGWWELDLIIGSTFCSDNGLIHFHSLLCISAIRFLSLQNYSHYQPSSLHAKYYTNFAHVWTDANIIHLNWNCESVIRYFCEKNLDGRKQSKFELFSFHIHEPLFKIKISSCILTKIIKYIFFCSCKYLSSLIHNSFQQGF